MKEPKILGDQIGVIFNLFHFECNFPHANKDRKTVRDAILQVFISTALDKSLSATPRWTTSRYVKSSKMNAMEAI